MLCFHMAVEVRKSSSCLLLPDLPHSMGKGLWIKEGTPSEFATTPATTCLSPFHLPCPAPQDRPSPGHHAQGGV